jgi:hypothetical protein
LWNIEVENTNLINLTGASKRARQVGLSMVIDRQENRLIAACTNAPSTAKVLYPDALLHFLNMEFEKVNRQIGLFYDELMEPSEELSGTDMDEQDNVIGTAQVIGDTLHFTGCGLSIMPDSKARILIHKMPGKAK